MNVNFNTTVETDVDELDAAIARLEALDGKSTEAGLFGGFAAQKAMWQEYGTSRGIPARPFLRNTMYESSAKWSRSVSEDVMAVFEGDLPGGAVVQRLGEQMVKDVRRTIDAGNFAPLSSTTVARKGSSRPLIDTGDMYASITHREA